LPFKDGPALSRPAPLKAVGFLSVEAGQRHGSGAVVK